ncbi:MAG: CoA transferase [Variibacter sp.]
MYQLLKGLRIVEGASFIAAPSCALHLLQLGAEVIRFDHIGGGPDFRRWPLSERGASFYWEGLNKGKKSVAIDLSKPEGRELAVRLATAPGENAGLFVTNYPADGFLSHDKLAARRSDIITVRVMGWADGATAVDYTINAAIGYPSMTGPAKLGDEPVNHVLPAWDLLTGASAAYALLAAERFRRETGKGQELRIPLGDIAMATLGHLGQIGEVTASGADRPRMGNTLYGAFGRDFATADGRRMMIIAITPRQWTGMLKALGIEAEAAAVEKEFGVSFAKDEGVRFEHRDRLFPLVEAAVAKRKYADLAAVFDAHDMCWGPYQTVYGALQSDPRLSAANPVFQPVTHPSGQYLTPGSPVSIPGEGRAPPPRAPRLGEHTDEVLADVLRLSSGEIGKLHDAKLVAGPA